MTPIKEAIFTNVMFAWHYRQARKTKAKVFGYFEDGRFSVGQQSKHRQLYARMWTCAMRLKKMRK